MTNKSVDKSADFYEGKQVTEADNLVGGKNGD